MEITRIGRCAGCEKSSRLRFELCPACFSEYGEKMGGFFRMIRTDPRAARMCYLKLADRGRAKFERIFGKPDGTGEAPG